MIEAAVLGFGATLALGASAWYLAPMGVRVGADARFRRNCRAKGLLALSYDDGPSETLTGQLVDLLGAADARATFFFLGSRVAAAPNVAAMVRAKGHEIGSHSYAHRHAWKCLPGVDVADLQRGFAEVGPLVSESGLYRPPYGKLSLGGLLAGKRAGTRPAWWTVDSGDTWDRLPEPSEVLANVEGGGGGVVLLHDFERKGIDAKARHAFVLETTGRLLDLARKRSWSVVPVGSVFGAGSAPEGSVEGG